MAGHAIIVIGASAGGIEGLITIMRGLPEDLNAAVFVTLHLSPNNVSLLPRILSRAGKLPAYHPADYEAIKPGRIYVTPPDHHLLVDRGFIRLTRGPKENGHRPSVDALFRTAAKAYGAKVVGVVLSGARDDGTIGLAAVKDMGGIAIVQDPEEALHPSMPQSAIDHVAVDHVVPLATIAELIAEYAALPSMAGDDDFSGGEISDVALLEGEDLEHIPLRGEASGFICPDCGGSLWEIDRSGPIRFRCRVGHAWSAESLLDEELKEVEEALWTALRALQEHAALARRVADNARKRGNATVAKRFEERISQFQNQARVIRRLLLSGEEGPDAGAGSNAV